MPKAVPPQVPAGLGSAHKADLLHRLRRAEGQVRGLQKLLDENADCTQIAQQLLATRHALDSTYVRLNLSFAEQALQHESEKSAAVSEVMARLQQQLGRRR
jgi:CsoR family transcriptional regulator, copper-sensing transcriptional repressor